MATRENQGLQIGLIICVMLNVGLLVGLFVLWRTNSALDGELAHSRNEAAQNRQGIGEANKKLNEIKKYLGYPQEAEVDEIKTNYDEDMTKFAENWDGDQENKNYRDLVSYLTLQFTDRSKRVTEEITRVDQTRNERDQAREQEQSNSEKYSKDQARLAKEFSGEKAKFEDDRTRITDEKSGLAQQLNEVKREKNTMETKKNERIALLGNEVKESKNVSEVLRDRIDDLTLKNPGQADGAITWVNHRKGHVYLDIGSQDGLRTQTTFTVFDESEVNVKVENKKGDIEVIRVLGPHRSIARVVENEVSRLILPRDTVYSAAWDRGRHLHFGLAGLLDIDGDGASDVETIRDIISLNGGIIDAEVDEEGNQKGELSMRTRFLIVGLKPGETEQYDKQSEETELSEKERARFSAAAETFQQIFGQAQRYSVERISLNEFLDLMGWHAGEKVTKLGTFSRTNDLGDDGVDAETSDGFRERRPPARGQNGAF